MELLFQHQEILTLFALSFLAATLLPLGSEWYLITLIVQGQDPLATVATATAGNVLGALTTYAIGFWGSTFITHKVLRISDRDSGKAMALYQRYGSWSLLFSWVPIVGDPLCLVAGSLKLHPLLFTVLVFGGKCTRYCVLAYLTLLGIS